MKFYLDENLSPRFRHCFDPKMVQVYTYQFMGWQGKKNGELLSLLSANNFRGIITSDKMMYSDKQLQSHNLHFLLIQSFFDTPNARTPLFELLNKYIIDNYELLNHAKASRIIVSDGIIDSKFPRGVHRLL